MTNYTTLNQAALDIASKISNTGSELYAKTAETLVRETPILAQEYVRWIFWSNIAELSLWIFAVIALCLSVKKFVPGMEKGDGKTTAIIFSAIGIAVFSLVAGYNGITNTKQAIKAAIAPRVILVEWVSNQVKP